jgi:PAS domain S-box-containing protein
MSDHEILALEEAVEADLAGGLEQWELNDSPARRQAALVILGRGAIQARDGQRLLADGAALAARTLDLAHFGVAQIRGDGRPLAFQFGTVDDAQEAAPREHLLSADHTQSAAAYTVNAGRVVVMPELAAEKRFQDGLLARHGVVSGILCPLSHAEQRFGVLCVFSTDPRNFAKEDVLFVQSMAQLLGSSVAHQRAESALSEQSKFLAATMDTMDGLVLMLSPEGRITRFNRACQNLTGFQVNEVKDRHVWSAFLLPEEVAVVKTVIDRLRGGAEVQKLEAFLLTKHGERRRIAWSFTSLRDEQGAVQSLVGSGIDVTLQCEAMENLERAEAEAEQARKALGELRAQLDNGDLVRLGKHLTPMRRGDVLPPEVKEDRRIHRRRAYPYVQIIAPVINNRLPELHQFYDVRCRDISPRGFSFLLSEPPAHQQYVVAFGAYPSQIFLVVKTMHYSSYRIDDRDMYLVGCRYVARADYDRHGPRDETTVG